MAAYERRHYVVPESVRALLTSDWAYLLIAWSLVLILTVYATFMALNVAMTPPLDDMAVVTGTPPLLTDARANIYPLARDMPHPLDNMDITASGRSGEPICDDIYDIYPGIVARSLYTRNE